MTPVGAILLDLMDEPDPTATLPDLLCRLTVARLPVVAASIALTDADGFSQMVAGSDPRAVELETLQFTLGEGPCHEAVRTGRLVQQQDLAGTGPARWPLYTEQMISLGIRATFSFPLRIGAIRLGVLDLFAAVPTVLTDGDLAQALHIVDAAVLIVLHLESEDGVLTDAVDGELGSAMTRAFHLDAAVHQATGMVSVQVGVGLSEALLLLRGHAYGEQRPISAVASDVVARRMRFS